MNKNNGVENSTQKDADIVSGKLLPISMQSVQILVTEDDKLGNDVSKMSDFMELFAQNQISALGNSPMAEPVLDLNDLPISSISVLGEVVQQATMIAKGDYTLIPDFAHLPSEIQEKIKKGIYKVGDSHQVKDNLRAVIVDKKTGVRVKDITLKKILNTPGSLEATRSISYQLQMKQIHDKLAAIQEIQNYQLDKDRDHQIFTPFFEARDFILLAQNSATQEERNKNLEKAADRLITAKNAINSELKTASEHLAKCSKWPFFHRQSTINTLTSHIAEDLQLSAKVCGIQMQVYEYLGKAKNAISVLEQYQANLLSLLTSDVLNSGYSAIELVHDNYQYNNKNRDFWYKFSEELKPKLSTSMALLSGKETYILSLEDAKDE